MREFDYKIIPHEKVTVVTFSGRISKGGLEQLETCRQQLVTDRAGMVVLYFKNVTSIDPCTFREMTMLQQEIRKKNSELYLVGLESSMRAHLLERAIVRISELRKTLEEVLLEQKSS